MNKKALKGGKVLLPNDEFVDYTVLIEGSQIVDLIPSSEAIAEGFEKIDVTNLIVAPGLIDTHIHGGLGYNFMDGTSTALTKISEYLVTGGVTSCLATTTSAGLEDIKRALANAKDASSSSVMGEIEILGTHLEGPFINLKVKGSHAEKFVRNATKEELEEIYKSAAGSLKVATLAPEIEGGMEALKFFVEHGVNVSIGHTTASYSQTKAAIGLGANRGTHVFNGMVPIHHREPGPVTALLENSGVFIELTFDRYHLAPPLVKLVLNIIGTDRCVLISDGADVCGQGDGIFTRWEGTKVIIENGQAKTTAGSLAGSTLQLNKAVANLVNILEIPLAKAIKMASENPARSIGVFNRKGSITPGKDADIVVLTKDLSVAMTIARGHIVYIRRT